MTPAQYEELMHTALALEALHRSLASAPYLDEGIRAGLRQAIEAAEKQLKTAPVA